MSLLYIGAVGAAGLASLDNVITKLESMDGQSGEQYVLKVKTMHPNSRLGAWYQIAVCKF